MNNEIISMTDLIRMTDEDMAAFEDDRLNSWVDAQDDTEMRLRRDLEEAHGRLHDAEAQHAALLTSVEEFADELAENGVNQDIAQDLRRLLEAS